MATLIGQIESNYYTRGLSKFVKEKKNIVEQVTKWGDLYSFRLALDFLSEPKHLVEILCVNKEWNSKFSKHIHKKVLTRSKNIPIEARLPLWKLVLDVVSSTKIGKILTFG